MCYQPLTSCTSSEAYTYMQIEATNVIVLVSCCDLRLDARYWRLLIGMLTI